MRIIKVNRCGECPFATMSKKKWICADPTQVNKGFIITDLSIISSQCTLMDIPAVIPFVPSKSHD